MAVTITAVAFLDFCDLVFSCGCRSLWNGAAEDCNIHVPGIPHCPWCRYGLVGGTIPFAAVCLVQGAVVFGPGARSWIVRLLMALVAFPLVGGVMAVLFAALSGYPLR